MRPSGNSFKYDDDMQKQIVADYENSRLSRREVAAKYNIGISTVDAYRRRWSGGSGALEKVVG